MKRRVDAYFEAQGISRRDDAWMYLKTAFIFAWSIGCYAALMLAPLAWWQAIPLTIGLAMGLAGIGFSIQHDANHGGYSRNRRVNRLLGHSLDLIGGSSYVWYYKHNIFHHTYTNISGLDADVDVEPFLRLAPDQPWRWYHRWQHVYVWFLYGLLAVHWHFWADYRDLAAGKIGDQPFPRPTRLGMAATLAGKLFFYAWSIILPLMFHPTLAVLGLYALGSFTLGILLAGVFQLAHCVEEAELITVGAPDSTREVGWAEHQVRTTANFAMKNPFLTWYLGGLNFQIEHHLFPKICHLRYPALSSIVAETCKDFGIPYQFHDKVGQAVASHVSRLRALGRKVPGVRPSFDVHGLGSSLRPHDPGTMHAG